MTRGALAKPAEIGHHLCHECFYCVSRQRGGSLSDTEPIVPLRRWRSGAAAETVFARPADYTPQISFDRRELNIILSIYGSKVAQGEWRDYAMNFGRERAEFCIFRRTSEMPLYRIVKQPKLARKQGMYAVVAHGGAILRRGHDLEQVLKTFRRKPNLSVI